MFIKPIKSRVFPSLFQEHARSRQPLQSHHAAACALDWSCDPPSSPALKCGRGPRDATAANQHHLLPEEQAAPVLCEVGGEKALSVGSHRLCSGPWPGTGSGWGHRNHVAGSGLCRGRPSRHPTRGPGSGSSARALSDSAPFHFSGKHSGPPLKLHFGNHNFSLKCAFFFFSWKPKVRNLSYLAALV